MRTVARAGASEAVTGRMVYSILEMLRCLILKVDAIWLLDLCLKSGTVTGQG